MIAPSRHAFPHLTWAWPAGRRHLLITAAVHPARHVALAAITEWLDTTNLDDTVFTEHRLLATITSRFDLELRSRPEYPRLQGMQRLNWTRSRLASAAATPVLAQMAAQGIRIVLLKGACRVALDPAEQKSRTSYDIDMLVRDDDFQPAFEVLAAAQWQSTRGESVMGLRARLSTVRARNFKKGHFGDIDLHRSPYHFGQQAPVADEAFFSEATPASYFGVPVFIPSVEERLCMAIAHGGRDSHGHSDWLVDIARMLELESINWDKVLRIVHQRRLVGAASIALSYLANGLAVPVPASVLQTLAPYPALAGLRHPLSVLMAKEGGPLDGIATLASALDNSWERLWHSGRNRVQDAPSLLALTRTSASEEQGSLVQPVALPPSSTPGLYRVELVLNFGRLSMRRRVDFELNSPVRNLVHLRALHLWTVRGGLCVRFRGTIRLNADDLPLQLHALPGKLLDETANSRAKEKYAPVPFHVVSAKLMQLSAS